MMCHLSDGFVHANPSTLENIIQIHLSRVKVRSLPLSGRKNRRRKTNNNKNNTEAQRAWRDCKLFRIAAMKEGKAERGAQLR